MPEEMEEMFEERVELKPKEKIDLLIMDAFTQRQLDEFKTIELQPENFDAFLAKVKQAISDNLLTLDEFNTEFIDHFSINPLHNRYFKVFMEKKDKEEKNHHLVWHGFTRLDWKENNTALMKTYAKFQPRNALLIEILLDAVEKQANLVKFLASAKKKPSFGKSRTDVAYEMAKQGQSTSLIAERIGKPMEYVRQYIIRGAQKNKDIEFIEQLKASK